MNLSPSFRSLSSSTLCAALVACAGTAEPPSPTVVRTPAPQNYEQTINNYFAFKVRNPQKNARIGVGQPEPGACALDGHVNSIRGWVVPVVYETRAGEMTGKETIRITVKPYHFWFLGNTIAGVTPRAEMCPGAGSAFEEGTPQRDTAAALQTTSLPLPAAAPETPARERADTATVLNRAMNFVNTPRSQKADAAPAKKKKKNVRGGARKNVKKPSAQ